MTPSSIDPASSQLILDDSATALTDSVLDNLHSLNSRRAYSQSIAALTAYARGKPLNRTLLLKWRAAMLKRSLSSSTVNVRLSAIRNLLEEARRKGQLSAADAADMLRVDGVPRRGSRAGNWLTAGEAKLVLAVPERRGLRGKRNYCILALLLGCALRREELRDLQLETLQRREGRWVLADIEGKGGRVRTVAVPSWVKLAIDDWTKAAGITTGRIIRRLTFDAAGLSVNAIWSIVRASARTAGLHNIGPHDLRRTCAKLCRARGGALEQIQLMLGHASIQTTERYLGSTQDLARAVNDDLGL